MQLATILEALDQIAPLNRAESWDNVGLLVGDPSQQVSSALLTIDYTSEVADEAQRLDCQLLIAYHPPIFHPLKRVTAPSLIHEAIRRGLAIYSPHTALDAADGGTNDVLADAIGMNDRAPLRLVDPKQTHCKLVAFVPEKDVEKLSRALFDAGAGWIGNYSCCSFRTRGTGTFFGEEGASPAVGQAGKLEQVAEIRLEMVVPIERIAAVVTALRQNHPYEEPAFDLVQLAGAPTFGQGRFGTIDPTPREQLFERIKRELGLTRLVVAGPQTGEITRLAVCAGACGELLHDALSQKVELYLTGEVRHHDALWAASKGMTVVCTLHSNSERAVLKRLAQRISEKLPELKLHVSQSDRDPFVIH